MRKGEKPSISKDYVVVKPSDLRKIAYCPTMYFFDVYVKGKPPLSLRLKAVWGRFLHVLHHTLRVGWTKEELMYAPMDEFKAVLIGKPDSYKIIGKEKVIVEEFKSRRSPRRSSRAVYEGVWISDAVQLMAYAYILRKNLNLRPVLVLRYVNRPVEIRYDEELLLKYVGILRNIVEGIFPEPEWVSRKKCRRCPYRNFCPYSPFSEASFT